MTSTKKNLTSVNGYKKSWWERKWRHTNILRKKKFAQLLSSVLSLFHECVCLFLCYCCCFDSSFNSAFKFLSWCFKFGNRDSIRSTIHIITLKLILTRYIGFLSVQKKIQIDTWVCVIGKCVRVVRSCVIVTRLTHTHTFSSQIDDVKIKSCIKEKNYINGFVQKLNLISCSIFQLVFLLIRERD